MQVEVQPKSVKPSNLRRSTRLTIAVPVDVSGTDAHGKSFSESTRTVTVNRHGGKFFLSHEVRLKDPVKLTSPRLNRSVNAVVVWLGKRRTESEPREVAVELLDPGNIWGVDFPPSDWKDAPGPSELVQEETNSCLPSDGPVAEVSATGQEHLATPEAALGQSAPPAAPALPDEKSPPGTGSNGNGRGSGPAVPELAESVNNLIRTALANFEEELGRIAKLHTKAFEKRAFGTAMESVETAKKEVRQVTPGLIQDSMAQLRSQIQRDLENFAASLEEVKQQATSDAVNTLRNRVAAALKALDG